jgi:hypothetical protein
MSLSSLCAIRPTLSKFVLSVVVLIVGSESFAHNHLRDLAQYEVAGPYQILAFSLTPEAANLDGQVREFLWTHWRQHRRGTVVATHQYVDAMVKTSYYIEPDQHRRWLIVEYTDYPYTQIRTREFSCSEFERVEPDRLHLPLRVIPDSEPRKPEDYLLHPVCSKGKTAKLW